MLLGQGAVLKDAFADTIRNEMAQELGKYAKLSHITVYCGTYNFNGQLPAGESLQSWITSNVTGLADIAVIGCQELIKLTPGEYITADTDKLRLIWEGALLRALNSLPGADYVVLRSIHLVALGMFVFVRQNTTSRLRQVEMSSIKTGLMGMAANKGIR
jgi:hypothetical protein